MKINPNLICVGEVGWTIPSLTSSTTFNQQTIELSTDDYDMVEVIYIDYCGTQRYHSVRVPKGNPINLNSLFDANQGKMYMGVRTIYITDDTHFWVNDCYSCITGTAFNVAVSNQWCIPTKIILWKNNV